MRRWLAAACVLLALVGSPALASKKKGTGPSSHTSTGKHRSTYCQTCPRDSHGRIKRSSTVRKAFLKSQGLTHTPKGCQVDHVTPLAKGGADTPSNMQLLCGEALKAKERTELR